MRRPVVVAIVDDGLRLTHRSLAPYLHRNPREVPANRRDDDGNGRVDDVVGYDLADEDPDASPPAARLAEFHHGTALASLVAGVVEAAYGPAAPRWLRLMPVKVLEDEARTTALRLGFRGIEYAVDAGADVVLAAFSVVRASPAEEQILARAAERGVLVVASAGNVPDLTPQYPAAHGPTLGVAALGPGDEKQARSGFGTHVDLVAPGEAIPVASSLGDDATSSGTGTSYAAALVAGAAAVLRLQRPEYGVDALRAALLEGARPLPAEPRLEAKLGAGALDLTRALAVDLAAKPEPTRTRPRGALVAPRKGSATFSLAPGRDLRGIWISPPTKPGGARGTLRIVGRSGGEPRVVLDAPLDALVDRVFIEGEVGEVTLTLTRGGPYLVEYAGEAIDHRTEFCRGTVSITTEGVFEDSSGPERYAAQSDCKWQITAPPGKVPRIWFDAFDTQAKVDHLYFFDGAGTHEPILAVWSGPVIPPEVFGHREQVLVWFVTDGSVEHQGFRGRVAFVEPAPR